MSFQKIFCFIFAGIMEAVCNGTIFAAEWYSGMTQYFISTVVIKNEEGIHEYLTRGEAAELLMKTGYFSHNSYVINPFADLQRGQEDFYSMIRMYHNNVMYGIEDATGQVFARPGEVLTREEAAALLVRAFELKDNGTGQKLQFSDEQDISEYAVHALKTCANLKILSGFPDGKVYPKRTITKVEFLTMLHQTIKILPIGYKKQNHLESVFFDKDRSKNVTLIIESRDDITSDSKLYLKFVNHSDIEYGYGVEYQLEKKENGKWFVVPFDNGDWDDVLNIIEPDSEREEVLDLHRYFTKLADGEYRIIYILNDTEFCSVKFQKKGT